MRASSRLPRGCLVVAAGLLLGSSPVFAPPTVGFPSAPARLAGITLGGSPRVLATFPEEDVVRLLDSQGAILKEVQVVDGPLGIAVGANRVFVGSAADGSVRIFDFKGRPQGSLGSGAGEFDRPGDIAVSPFDGRIYVADTVKRELRVFDPGTLQSLGSVGGAVLVMPAAVAVGADGTVFVADLLDGKVSRFGSDGTFLARMTSYGGYPGETRRPIGLTLDPAGRVYVTDCFSDVVNAYGTDYRFLDSRGEFGNGAGLLRNPLDTYVNPVDGTLMVADLGDRELEFYPAIP